MSSVIQRLAVSLLFLSLSTGVGANMLSPADRETIQQQQRELLQQNQQQRQELQRSLTPTRPQAPAASAPGGPCFTINTVRLEGADHLPANARQSLTQPYLQRCLSLAQINTLVRQVSDWYIERGYITSRAFLTEQDLSHGELKLLVLEGQLEKILLDQRDDQMLKMAFPGLVGNILNLRDIEQGMEQINRLRQQPVQIEILPGSQPGYSVVNLTAKPEFPVMLGLGFDNSGQKSTGTGQINGSLAFEILCDHICEYDVNLSQAEHDEAIALAKDMGFDVSNAPYNDMKQLII